MSSNLGTANKLYEKVEFFAQGGGKGQNLSPSVDIGRPHTLDFSPKTLLSQDENCMSNCWPFLTYDLKRYLRKTIKD